MAKPPEPLTEVLLDAVLIVDAVVKEVVSTGAPLPAPDKPAEWSDRGTQHPQQVLVLEVARVLKGALDATTVQVTKPAGAYMVKAGTKGAWLLDDKRVVLGRYGPDSWALDRVEAAVKH